MRQEDISRHIYEFYINLMGSCEAQGAGLRTYVWEGSQRVLDCENDELGLAFLPEERRRPYGDESGHGAGPGRVAGGNVQAVLAHP